MLNGTGPGMGRITDARNRGAIGLLVAIVTIQLFYWLVANPLLFAASPKVAKLPIDSAAVAELRSPDARGLATARFSPAELPWDGCCTAGYRGVRMDFTLGKVPDEGLGIVPHIGSDNYRIYVNGSLFYADGEMVLPKISYHGNVRTTFRIPPALLKPGGNRLDFILVRDAGTPFFSAGPPAIGDYATIKQAYSRRNFSLGSYLTMSQGIGFAATFLAFILWFRSDRNPAIFWMAVLCGAWSLRIMHHRATYPAFHGELRIIFLYLYVNLAPLALLNFANHWTGEARRWVTRLSVLAYGLVMAAAAAIIWFGLFQKIDTADRISMAFVLAMALTTLALFAVHYAKRAETRHWEAAIFVLCCTLFGHDALSTLFDLSYGDHVKRALPVLLLGFVAPFFANNVRLFRSMSEINLLLQSQLDQRTAELELAHAREKNLVRAKAHQNERQRIMRDMHDGLGSQLMSMLLAARQGVAKPAAVAEGLQAVIDEMRLLIDSMDSVGESLGSAFAIFRERVRPRVEEAGLDFVWRDGTDGNLPGYGPRDVLQVFRIMQEAVANALKHAGASELAVSLEPSLDPAFALRLTIADNGKGMGKANARGKGLESMTARAASIGGRVQVADSGKGVAVVLDLPEPRGKNGMP